MDCDLDELSVHKGDVHLHNGGVYKGGGGGTLGTPTAASFPRGSPTHSLDGDYMGSATRNLTGVSV